MIEYRATLAPQPEGGYTVTFPDVPEAVTQGDTREEALENAVEALEVALTFYVEAGQPLPKARRRRGVAVRPSALESAKLAIYDAMVGAGMRRGELARALGWTGPQIGRLFDLRHASRMDQIEAAAAALGKRVEVNVR